jgi:hypothetical protein
MLFTERPNLLAKPSPKDRFSRTEGKATRLSGAWRPYYTFETRKEQNPTAKIGTTVILDFSQEASMADEPAKSDFSDIAVDRLTNARLDVEAASEQVGEVEQHFAATILAAKTSRSFWEFLEDRTRAAPLTMLGLAFIAGVVFVRRR